MAGGRIKGITIEIDGSTTGLNKALKGTESNLSSVQRSLKDVNRLLKVDPSNTELLSQKQRLLSQAIDETKKKLEALKNANEQAAKTAGNYDAWKEAYTPIQEEITKTQDKVKTLKEKMSELEKAGKVDTSGYKELEGELKKEEEHLKDLKQQAKATSDEFGNPISHEQYDNLQREIIETEQELKNLEKQSKESSSVLGSQMQVVGGKISEAGGKISDVGKKLTPVSVAIAGAGVAGVKMASDFESAMSDVAATMGTTTDNITELSDKAREMGAKTSFSATEAAQGLNILAMSGLDTKEQIAAIEPVLNLASAGTLSLESAASYAMGAIKGFGDSCENAQYYTDLMAKGATLANTDVNGLGEALSGSAATAKSYGQSADSVTLSLLRLAEQNITGSEATTALNRAMADLYTPTNEAKEALNQLGVSAYNADGSARDMNDVIDDLSAAVSGMSDEEANAYKNTIFTTQGLSAFNKMTSTSKDKVNEFKEGLASASDGMGSSAEQAQTKLDNLQGQLTILKSAVSEAGISIGEILIPIIKDVVGKIQEWTDKFNSLDDNQKKMIVTIAGIVAAVAPVISVIGKITSFVGGIITKTGSLITFLGGISGAALPIIGIIAGVTAAGVLLYQNWDTIKEKAGQLGSWVSEKWTSLKESTTEAWENMKSSVSEKLGGIKESVSESVENTRSRITEGWDNIKTNTQTAWLNIKSSVQENGGGIKGVISTSIEGWRNIWDVGFSEINTLTGGKLGSALSTVQSKTASIKQAFKDKINGAKEAVGDAIEKIKSKFNFSWSLPKLKLPHVSISGGFSINPPSVPEFGIKWYKKAMDKVMVMSSPTAFGYDAKTNELLAGGEAGNEIISGEEHLVGLITGAVQNQCGQIETRLDQLTGIVRHYFPQVLQNMDRDLVMDGDTVVGCLAPKIDEKLGRIYSHKERWN